MVLSLLYFINTQMCQAILHTTNNLFFSTTHAFHYMYIPSVYFRISILAFTLLVHQCFKERLLAL